ncbi:Uncharacterised protein [Mycobacteroides abscessus subsp. abscessus]|nr:Uncharacterised protein [Mycobacteroides abscessus subsp. abscessus]
MTSIASGAFNQWLIWRRHAVAEKHHFVAITSPRHAG